MLSALKGKEKKVTKNTCSTMKTEDTKALGK